MQIEIDLQLVSKIAIFLIDFATFAMYYNHKSCDFSKEMRDNMATSLNLQYIKNRRQNLGFSQKEMANTLGLMTSEKYYRRESGQYSFKVSELPPLAKKLDIPIKKLYEKHCDYRKA